MGDRTLSDVHPWQLIDLWIVWVEVYTVMGSRQGCGPIATTVVTQPAATVSGEGLPLLLLGVLGDAGVPRLADAVTMVLSLGMGLAEKLRDGIVNGVVGAGVGRTMVGLGIDGT